MQNTTILSVQVGFVKRFRILSPGCGETAISDWITRISVTCKEVHPGGVSGSSKLTKRKAFEGFDNF